MRHENPDFPATRSVVAREWRRMAASPRALARPLVILGGWRAPLPPLTLMAARLRKLTGAAPEHVLTVAYPLAGDIEAVAALAVRRIEERWPSDDPERTAEVDVIGVSMGGLVARVAAHPAAHPTSQRSGASKRLRIARLFTLGTPHRGAKLAKHIALDHAARCMRAGSDFLCRLDERSASPGYQIIPYARLRDAWVGARNTAPRGMDPLWVGPGRLLSHMTITHDRRILVDIARRLRGEEPLARRGTPPPTD